MRLVDQTFGSRDHRRPGAEGPQKLATAKFATRGLALSPVTRLRFLHREPPEFRFAPAQAGSAKASVSMSMNARPSAPTAR